MRIALVPIVAVVLLFGCQGEKLEPSEYLRIKTSDGDLNFPIELVNQYSNGKDRDQLSLSLKNRDGLVCNIFVMYGRFLARNAPFVIPSDDFGTVEIQLIDTKAKEDVQFGPEDNTSFRGDEDDGVEIKIESFEDDVLVATINGPLRTSKGRVKLISGEFRLRVNVVRN